MGGGGASTDGVVLQCVRVERLGKPYDGSREAVCCSCRQRVWLSKPAVALTGTPVGIKPVCDVCQPAKAVGPITPGK